MDWGASLAAVRAMCDWRPRQAIAEDRAAAATKDLLITRSGTDKVARLEGCAARAARRGRQG